MMSEDSNVCMLQLFFFFVIDLIDLDFVTLSLSGRLITAAGVQAFTQGAALREPLSAHYSSVTCVT